MPHWTYLIEFMIFEIAVVAWGLWELRSLRRERDKERKDDGPDQAP
jgi:hypothetical protein